MKKIIYISRLFSGFQKSVSEGKWKPSGATTIFKFFHFAKKNFELEVFFTHRDKSIKNFKIKKKKLRNFFKLSWLIELPEKNFFLISDIIHLIYDFIIFFKILKRKPSIIYATNQNLMLAVLFKLFTNYPVVLRVMGVFDVMRTKKNLKDYLFQLLYKVQFDLVVITEDGSGTEEWANQTLNKFSKKLILINGVDKVLKIKKNRKYYSDILFVGRLESGKGIKEFVQNIIYLSKKIKIKVGIIGSGPDKKLAYNLLKKNNINFFINENVPHHQVMKYFANTKIYVSLNKRGNISNTNLEAFNNNCTMLIPNFNSPLGEVIDKSTKLLFTNETVFYYDFDKKYNLAKKIIFLLKNDKLRKIRKKNLFKIRKFFLTGWHERIKEEILEVKKL